MDKKNIVISVLLVLLVAAAGFIIIYSDNSELDNLDFEYNALEIKYDELNTDYDELNNKYYNLTANSQHGYLIEECEITRTMTYVSHITTTSNSDGEKYVVVVFSIFQSDPVTIMMTLEKFDELALDAGKTYEISLEGLHSDYENYNFDSMSLTYEVKSALETDKEGMEQIQEICQTKE